MTSISAERVQQAVLTVCPDVAIEVQGWRREVARDEGTLWRQFMNCLLSSQVKYELACAAALEIEDAGILTSSTPEAIAADLCAILARPFRVDGQMRRYRFYNTKASQLARSWTIIRTEGGLGSLVDAFEDDRGARKWLVQHLPGLGFKQASMFLRDIGFSQDLAVLDRHTLDYMALVGLRAPGQRYVPTGSQYLGLEDRLRDHASGLGYSLGHLDRAIWVVMRARAQIAGGSRA